MRGIRVVVGTLLALVTTGLCAHAETQFSVYGGVQAASPSHVTITGTSPASFDQRWVGDSFKTPPYWGVRATWWVDKVPGLGISIDYAHAKVYGRPLPAGWDWFEFTDGLNMITANAMYRWQEPQRRITPYVGVGVGVAIPHVEVDRGSGPFTFRYEVGGPAFQAQAGVDVALTRRWSVFTEYKANYAMVNVGLDDGDRLKTNVLTHAVDFGVSFHWK